MERECSLLNLKYEDAPTVIQLYTIAKRALYHQIQNYKSTVDVLIDSSTMNNKQFKRIIEECNQQQEGREDIKRIKALASAGVLFAETCLKNIYIKILVIQILCQHQRLFSQPSNQRVPLKASLTT